MTHHFLLEVGSSVHPASGSLQEWPRGAASSSVELLLANSPSCNVLGSGCLPSVYLQIHVQLCGRFVGSVVY